MRISSLPRFLDCPSSELPIDHPYDPPSGEPAAMGTAVHEMMAWWVARLGVAPTIVDIHTCAKKHGVDQDELEKLFAYGCIAWAELEKYFPNARTEEPVSGDGIAGTQDVFHRDDATMAVLDWKTNRVRRDYDAQLLGYAAAAVDTYSMPESGVVTVCIVWLRFFEYEVKNYTQDDIERFYHRVKQAELDKGKRYSPGESCTYCKRQNECGARQEYLNTAGSALMDVGGHAMSRETLALFHGRAQTLNRALKQYQGALRLALTSGPLPDGNGNMLSLEESTRDKISPLEAWPVLTAAGFDDDDMAACVTMKKTEIGNIAAGKVSKNKGKARALLMDALLEAGAVKQKVSETIKVTKGEQHDRGNSTTRTTDN